MKEAKEVKAYLANQLGFSETGRLILDNYIKPKITAMGIIINDPFVECGKELDLARLSLLKSYAEVMSYWRNFNLKVTPINNGLMRRSNCLLGILDGAHALDDGVSGEISFYAALELGPIFALRTDLRGGENIATLINPQILGYILMSEGFLSTSLADWFAGIKKWKDAFVHGDND